MSYDYNLQELLFFCSVGKSKAQTCFKIAWLEIFFTYMILLYDVAMLLYATHSCYISTVLCIWTPATSLRVNLKFTPDAFVYCVCLTVTLLYAGSK